MAVRKIKQKFIINLWFQRSGVQSGMYLENDPNMGYAPQTAHPGGLHTHFSPPASLARVSPQETDPWSDPIYHAGQPYSNR